MLQRFEKNFWATCALIMALFPMQCRADLMEDIRARYPRLIETGDVKELSTVPLNSSAAQAAISSKHARIIANAGIAANSAYLRLARVDSAEGSQYYIVREGGFGMAEILVYGPLDLLTKVDKSKTKQ